MKLDESKLFYILSYTIRFFSQLHFLLMCSHILWSERFTVKKTFACESISLFYFILIPIVYMTCESPSLAYILKLDRLGCHARVSNNV